MDHLPEASPLLEVKPSMTSHQLELQPLASPQLQHLQKTPLLQHLTDPLPRKTLLNHLQSQSPSTLLESSMESWMISETSSLGNHKQLQDSPPPSDSLLIKKNPRKRLCSPSISLQLNQSSNSLLKWLNIDIMHPMDLGVSQSPMSHLTDKPCLLDQLSLNNSKSEDERSVSPEMMKTLMERMTNLNDSPTNKFKFSRRICPGTTRNLQLDNPQIQVVQKPMKFLSNSPKAILQSKIGSLSPTVLPADSLLLNGKTSSREGLSVSTMSLAPSTISHQLKKTLDSWDQLKSILDMPNLLEKSRQMGMDICLECHH